MFNQVEGEKKIKKKQQQTTQTSGHKQYMIKKNNSLTELIKGQMECSDVQPTKR